MRHTASDESSPIHEDVLQGGKDSTSSLHIKEQSNEVKVERMCLQLAGLEHMHKYTKSGVKTINQYSGLVPKHSVHKSCLLGTQVTRSLKLAGVETAHVKHH